MNRMALTREKSRGMGVFYFSLICSNARGSKSTVGRVYPIHRSGSLLA